MTGGPASIISARGPTTFSAPGNQRSTELPARRLHRKHESAAYHVPAESGAGPVLQLDRADRRREYRQLQRPVVIARAPLLAPLHVARELHLVALHEHV